VPGPAADDVGATNASELGRRLAVTKQAALRTIAVLTERGWVMREQDPDDARRMRLRLTDRGHEVMAVGEEIFDDLRQAWEKELGARELATLEAQLTRMVGDAPVRLEAPGWVARDEG
jgi:DNA-binding MarR family transcriptional regulator